LYNRWVLTRLGHLHVTCKVEAAMRKAEGAAARTALLAFCVQLSGGSFKE
jgi:hypothetical protein